MALATAVASCGPGDAAHREYMAALRGEETGMGRVAQIERLTRAIALAPGRAVYWETRATYRIDVHDYRSAILDLDRAVALADRPYVRFMRGLARCQAGDVPGSLPDFDAAIAGHPENAQFYRGRSLARSHAGDPAGGLVDAERLVSLAPQVASSYYARGVALARLGRDREALRDFTESLQRQPELVYPLEERAAAQERLGRSAEAAADLEALAAGRRERDGCDSCLDPFRY